MAVYGVYVPTAKRPVSGLAMELFPSQEVAGWCLLERGVDRAGRTWYLEDRQLLKGLPLARHPRAVWELADETGYMRVWVRRARDPIPRLSDTPDEEWLVEAGGKRGRLVRLPWDDLDAVPAPAPAPVNPPVRARAGRTPGAGRKDPTPPPVAPQAAVCGRCFQLKATSGACGCPGPALRYTVDRPSRAGWQTCESCGCAVTAYARCGCS